MREQLKTDKRQNDVGAKRLMSVETSFKKYELTGEGNAAASLSSLVDIL